MTPMMSKVVSRIVCKEVYASSVSGEYVMSQLSAIATGEVIPAMKLMSDSPLLPEEVAFREFDIIWPPRLNSKRPLSPPSKRVSTNMRLFGKALRVNVCLTLLTG